MVSRLGPTPSIRNGSGRWRTSCRQRASQPRRRRPRGFGTGHGDGLRHAFAAPPHHPRHTFCSRAFGEIAVVGPGCGSGDPNHVFLNAPFDEAYLPLLHSLLFTVHACGFVARTALEDVGGAEQRPHKIARIIDETRYSSCPLGHCRQLRFEGFEPVPDLFSAECTASPALPACGAWRHGLWHPARPCRSARPCLGAPPRATRWLPDAVPSMTPSTSPSSASDRAHKPSSSAAPKHGRLTALKTAGSLTRKVRSLKP